MAPPTRMLRLHDRERAQLALWARGRTTPQRLALRSRIVLLTAEGLSSRAVAERLNTTRRTVDLWRNRFHEGGCGALVYDKPRRGRTRFGIAHSES